MKEYLKELEFIRWDIANDEYLKYHVKSVVDLYNEYYRIKNMNLNNDSIDYILELVQPILISLKRARKALLIELLYKIIKNRKDEKLSEKTVNKLFEIYQHYIFIMKENKKWHLSVLLKNQKLNDIQLKWLIYNVDNNEYILNRILKYPEYNNILADWAMKCIFEKNYIEKRISEYIALTIQENIPLKIVDMFKTKISILAWSVYFSKSKSKEDILIDLIKIDPFCNDIANVTRKINSIRVLDEIIKAINMRSNNT